MERYPPDLAVAVLAPGVRLESDELCRLTYLWPDGAPGATLRFVGETPLFSREAATYRQVDIDFPAAEGLGVSIWECEELADRVLVAKRAGPDVVDGVVHYLRENPYLDCRTVALSKRETLRDDVEHIFGLGFLHLPSYTVDNVGSTVAHCLTQMTHKRAFRSTPPERPERSVAMVVPTFQGGDIHATPGNAIPMLSARGRPLIFDPPLSSYGFIANAKIATFLQEGIEVSDKTGLAMHGPYMRVPPGRYSAVATIKPKPVVGRRNQDAGDGGAPEGYVSFDAYIAPDPGPLSETMVSAFDLIKGTLEIEVEFVVPQREDIGLLELRLHQQSDVPFLVGPVELTWLE